MLVEVDIIMHMVAYFMGDFFNFAFIPLSLQSNKILNIVWYMMLYFIWDIRVTKQHKHRSCEEKKEE